MDVPVTVCPNPDDACENGAPGPALRAAVSRMKPLGLLAERCVVPFQSLKRTVCATGAETCVTGTKERRKTGAVETHLGDQPNEAETRLGQTKIPDMNGPTRAACGEGTASFWSSQRNSDRGSERKEPRESFTLSRYAIRVSRADGAPNRRDGPPGDPPDLAESASVE